MSAARAETCQDDALVLALGILALVVRRRAVPRVLTVVLAAEDDEGVAVFDSATAPPNESELRE